MLAKARLVEIESFAKKPQAKKAPGGKIVEVQFNPQSLKLTLSNQNTGGDQPGGVSKQFVGSGTSKMSVELLFDTTAEGGDVRKKTEEVAYFIMAKPQRKKDNKRVPPRVRFQWGSFIFEGVVDSMNETLDYFSEEGVPMRATVSLDLSRDDIVYLFGDPQQAAGGTADAGQAAGAISPLEAARPGDSVQSLAGREGRSKDWKAIATANNIDDPLRLRTGTLVNLDFSAARGRE